jgi:hypothetical protein
LATVDAYFTASARIRVGLSIVISLGHRFLYTPLGYTPQDTAAATAAVADVADIFNVVAYSVYQPDFLRFVDKSQCCIL